MHNFSRIPDTSHKPADKAEEHSYEGMVDMEPGSVSILVVDDEEPIRKVLQTHLSREGFDVTLSAGGSGVFGHFEEGSFDVLVCDIRMPEVDGIDILEHVTTNHPTTPVVMLTGLTDVATAIEVMKKGAFDYLMKPVKKEDLLTAIHKARVHGRLLKRNRELERENMEYQLLLEQKVKDRTRVLNQREEELSRANNKLKSMNMRFVNVLAEAIEAKDRHTRGHCNRMRELSVEMGRILGLDEKQLELLEYSSVLHDLGKIGVSEAVLNKEGPLDERESEHIKEHPVIGERILEGVEMMDEVAHIIGAHHENYDGGGYPRGLRGEEIPLLSRIIAVVDLFDAMKNTRPYRRGLEVEKVLAEMNRVAGTQLDPDLVKVFIENEVYKVVDKFARTLF